mmetsp:Transcript_86658/g.156075  ORF Transcript_86658/g.156075 Transcript_86658/m.156075 type:complete len:236 (-) Transcript_86658:2496-3203(-)
MRKTDIFQLDIMRPQTNMRNHGGPCCSKSFWIQRPFQQPAPPEKAIQYQWYRMMPAAAQARAADNTSSSCLDWPLASRISPSESLTSCSSCSPSPAESLCSRSLSKTKEAPRACCSRATRSIFPFPSLGSESRTKTTAGHMLLGSFSLHWECTLACKSTPRPATQATKQPEPSLWPPTTAASLTPGICEMTASTSSGATRIPRRLSCLSTRPCTCSSHSPEPVRSSIQQPRSPER